MPENDPNIKEIKIKPENNKNKTQNKQNKSKQIIMRVFAGIGAVSILAGGFMIYNANATKKQDIAQIQKNKDKISNLKDQLAKVEAERPTVTVSQGQDALATAIDSGNKLANLQNQYISVGNDRNKIQNIVKQEMPLLKSKDDKATAWFDTGNPKTQGKWTFASKYQFSQNEIKAVFLNRNDKNQLLAYATADYYPNKKQFSNIEVVETNYGRDAVAYTDTRKANEKKKADLNNAINDVKKATKDDKPVEFTQKQREEIADQQWKDFQKMKKQRGE